MEKESPCVELVYQRLVQLVARAFYAVDLKDLFKDEQPEPHPLPPSGKSKKPPADYTGLGVVVMDALLFRPWWEEEDFAKRLGLPIRPVRQILRLLETHCLLAREHRKEKRRKTEKEAKRAAEMIADGDVVEENTEEKGLLISYSSLDYQRFYDTTRFRLHRIRQKLKEELEDKRAVQEYACPECGRTFTTLQAPFLIKQDGLFHCEDCDTVLETARDGQADGTSRRERSKVVKAKQAKLEDKLRPLNVVLAEIEKKVAGNEQIPDFGTLATWAASEVLRNGDPGSRANRARNQTAEISIDMGGPEVEIAGSSDAAPRELPPWLQRQQASAPSTSYSLSQEVSADGNDAKDVKDIKSSSPEDAKKLEEKEYMRQYQERMAQIAAQDSKSNVKRQKTEGGWQEVAPEGTNGGWQDVGILPGASKAEPAVKQEDVGNQAAAATPTTMLEGGEAEDEEEWEDA